MAAANYRPTHCGPSNRLALWPYGYTGSARNRVRNSSNLVLSIAYSGSHVALSQHLLSFVLQGSPWGGDNTKTQTETDRHASRHAQTVTRIYSLSDAMRSNLKSVR